MKTRDTWSLLLGTVPGAGRLLDLPDDTVIEPKPGVVVDLPVWTDGHEVVSCWRPSLRERISVLLFGRVWLHVQGRTHPPAAITGCRSYFKHPLLDHRQVGDLRRFLMVPWDSRWNGWVRDWTARLG